jgi:hypothetical protein
MFYSKRSDWREKLCPFLQRYRWIKGALESNTASCTGRIQGPDPTWHFELWCAEVGLWAKERICFALFGTCALTESM